MKFSKITTVLWGIIVTIIAFFVGDISSTILESIGIIGSVFYGPILAAFLAGVCFSVITTRGIFVGILFGVAFNLILHFWFSGIFWMWWNLTGCVGTMAVAFVISFFDSDKLRPDKSKYIIWNTDILDGERAWIPKYLTLVAYCAFMIFVAWIIPHIFHLLKG